MSPIPPLLEFGLATEKDMLKCSSPGSQNAILFGSQVAAGVISYDEVMLELDGPQSNMTDVLIRGQSCEDKDAQGEHCDGGGRGWCHAAARPCALKRPGNQQTLGRGEGRFSGCFRWKLGPADTLTSDFQPPGPFLLFQATRSGVLC